ncbi:MAG: hypothetical protein AAB778_03810 [Patescibacteria group bacterium]
MALTNGDKQFILEAIKSAFSIDRKYWKVYLDDLFDIKLGKKFKEKFGNLPTKDQFYIENLKIYKRLDDVESQGKMLSSRTYDNTDKIAKLEKIHPHNTHPVFA